VDASTDYSNATSITAGARAIEFIPGDYFAPLDLATIFSRLAPLEVDLGCGDGSFLNAMAPQFPERNFLGVERLLGRVNTGCRHAARAHLPNVRFLRLEFVYAMQFLLPARSVDVAHLLFPDPWPKSRHRRRRTVTPEFLSAIYRLLAPNGRFRIATDQEKYFRAIHELILPDQFIEISPNESKCYPLTTFEKRFVEQGLPIHRLELRKIG
jgi:tRNA (guanine-N7-)-methyltransferase